MVQPLARYHVTLTGQLRPRVTWRGQVVLQVQEKHERMCDWEPTLDPQAKPYYTWRDAKPADLSLGWAPMQAQLAAQPASPPPMQPPPRKP